jgi:pimeloyl-ACP methyl ester carboxylesterase
MAAWTIPVEAFSTLREVMLMPRDLAPIVPRIARDEATDVVVLVHGFFASAGVFRPLKKRLERNPKTRVASFSHLPGATVPSIAFLLGHLVAKIPNHVRVHVVGHSLGGVVARYYVQELGGHARVAQTISLAAPFGGAPMATRAPVFVGRDLHPESSLLARIRARAAEHGVPHVSIAGTDDRTVPHASAIFPWGETISLEGRGHNTLLFDEEVARIVVDRIKTIGAGGAGVTS